MDNISSYSFFTLTALDDYSTSSRITIFCFALSGYCLTVFVNLVLIFIIILEKILHQPMYIFVCSLCINGLFGATGFYPSFLYYLLMETNVISFEDCVIQSIAIFSYGGGEFTNLTVMAFDRYLAICRPLYYHTVMTSVTVWRLLTFIWLYPSVTALVMLLMTLRFPLCINQIDKLYCETWILERLACQVDTAQFVISGIFAFLIVAMICFVICSYIKIIIASKHSVQNYKKFMNTCLPHLVALLNYVLWSLLNVTYVRFGSSTVPQAFKNFMSVSYMIPPLVNPIQYLVWSDSVQYQVSLSYWSLA
ncbi:olfactory receptor-like protein OLF3 [Misgurnus anguillicaudatus]|uniref:olfactory receptor-like protein OLF3 n=1 Tax=Misgurnus anguillicaudatus TaxID=75329 RepID=UPI003CCF3F2E